MATAARNGFERPLMSFLVLALMSTGFASEGFSPLAGRVVESGTNAPVAGARIVGTISGRTAWTGIDGGFELPGIEAKEDSVVPVPQVRGGSGLVRLVPTTPSSGFHLLEPRGFWHRARPTSRRAISRWGSDGSARGAEDGRRFGAC